MSMADRDGFIWQDGKLVPWREATTHVLTHSLHYGLAVFEGVRAYNTVSGTAIFRLAEHTQRLINSAKIYMMDIPYAKDELMEAQREVVRANKLESCYLRPIAFYGSEKMGISTVGATVHVAIAAWPWGAYLGEEGLQKGIRVKTSSYTRHHVNSTMPRAKLSGTYPNSILANLEVTRMGYDEALLLDNQPLHRQGRAHLRTRDRLGADRHHPRLDPRHRARTRLRGRHQAPDPRRHLSRRRSLLHRHRRRSHPDPRARRPQDRRRQARPGHRKGPGPLLRHRERPCARIRALARPRLIPTFRGLRHG